MDSAVTGPADTRRQVIELDRFQFGVVILLLVMSVSWLLVYSTVIAGPAGPTRASPKIAAKLAEQHAKQLRTLQLQMIEIYGGTPPPPAGS